MFSLKIHSSETTSDAIKVGDDVTGIMESEEENSDKNFIHFSSGNPRVEISRGVVHLFRDTNEKPGSLANLPKARTEDLCVLAVPDYMTGADFCKFTGSFLTNIREIRIVRNDAVPNCYMALLKLDSQETADDFYRYFNGREYSSMEPGVCRVVFTADVQFTGDQQEASSPPTGLTELPTCTFCLERLDVHISGVLTTVCNHSFHSSCMSQWDDSSCPVCRYCQEQPEESVCTTCGTRENLWMCLICGFIGCGRYKEGHGISHWKETQHCYSLELGTQRVWDYVGDGYVHRLIQSKTDGKLVELPAPCTTGRGEHCSGEGGCQHDPDTQEAIINSKVGQVAEEFNHLLYTQLDNQRQYFEGLLAESKAERDQSIASSVENIVSLKLQKMNGRLEKAERERDKALKEMERLQKVEKELKDMLQLNAGLCENLKDRNQRLREQDAREKQSVQARDDRITDLEEQVRDLMVFIEAQKTLEQTVGGLELKDGTVLGVSGPPPTSPQVAKGRSLKSGRRNR